MAEIEIAVIIHHFDGLRQCRSPSIVLSISALEKKRLANRLCVNFVMADPQLSEMLVRPSRTV